MHTEIWLAAAVAGVNFFASFIGLVAVERIGRRPLTLYSLSGMQITFLSGHTQITPQEIVKV